LKARAHLVTALVERFRPKIIYTIPTAHNPTGVTTSDDRRRHLAVLAQRHNLIVVEDDTCSEFTFEGEAPPAIKAFDEGGHVVFIKSFSKTVVPGLRVGCVIAQGTILARLVESKSLVDRFTSPLIQRTLWRYLDSRQYVGDLRTARNTYRRRRDRVLEMLKILMPPGVDWTYPAAGFNLWLNLPEGVSAIDAFEEGLKEGVACGFGDLFLPHPPPPSGMRISFADKSEEVLTEGIKRLACSISRLASREPGKIQESEFVGTI
jgi:DNA-binding transcriptional MocR family regulator